ncbi:MAG: Eco57I restriction-modification methylase domain-containing protein [Albidovulum sp.]
MSVGAFTLRGRNPDVLSCIANLSNDEVFTPPEFANRMLDTLAEAWAADHGGASIWANPDVTFLDPCTKSGVFLREIAKRLIDGLEGHIPDRQARVDHILTRQVFGIGITELTAMLARRSLYCSKHANSKHSIARGFNSEAGNVWFERVEHDWEERKCKICGAPKEIFDRPPPKENHAYAFIHAREIHKSLQEWFEGKMKFDVVIGNPPYQMTGGAGGTSDASIYHLFVEQAISLGPHYLSMVIPSRWMAGGRGLDDFREMMLSRGHVRHITDFPNSSDAFAGVQIKGGICFFLWDNDRKGPCKITRMIGSEEFHQEPRSLDEFDVLIRDANALSILRKVQEHPEDTVLDLISGDTPFGLATNFSEWSTKSKKDSIILHLIANGKRTVGHMDPSIIRKNTHLLPEWKLIVPKAYGAGETYPHQILGKSFVSGPQTACTQSYLVIGPFQSENAAVSFHTYYSTRFFRFLVSLRKITQDALRSTYSWVPKQTWDRQWTDQMLYEKYGLSADEIAFIEAIVRPMDMDLLDNLADD